MKLLQYIDSGRTRVARVDQDGSLRPLARFITTYQLAERAIAERRTLEDMVNAEALDAPISYDDLLRDAKRAAVERGTTLTAVIEDALRRALAPAETGRRKPFTMVVFEGEGLRPGVDLDDTASLLDRMDERDARA